MSLIKKNSNNRIITKYFKKYNLSSSEKKELLSLIKPIYSHSEFQRRLTDEFSHHDNLTLGEHILKVTIITYKKIKKSKNKNINLRVAITIAMLHDLYTEPWQNNPVKDKKIFNKHGFRHPVEAVINSLIWYPELFEDEQEAKMIIDGIIHHMFPFPSLKYKENLNDKYSLKNYKLINEIEDRHKNNFINSANRGILNRISIRPSKYIEGRIVANADNWASISDFKITNIMAILTLVTGINKKLR